MAAEKYSRLAPKGEAALLAGAVERLQSIMGMVSDRERRDPEFGAYLTLVREIGLLGYALSKGATCPTNIRYSAYAVLVRRFGVLGARHLIEITKPKSGNRWILDLRERLPAEQLGDSREAEAAARNRDDAALLAAFMRARKSGIRAPEALTKAVTSLDRISRGEDGAKKAITRAIEAARVRGYVDPLWPSVAAAFGFADKPDLSLEDLPRKGRPKNCDP